jgi:hypothetical protein
VESVTLWIIPVAHQSDELIENILFLSMNETGEGGEPPDPSPFVDPPLQNIQWLGVYGEQKLCHVTHKCRAGDDQTRRKHAQPQGC